MRVHAPDNQDTRERVALCRFGGSIHVLDSSRTLRIVSDPFSRLLYPKCSNNKEWKDGNG